MTLTKYCKMRQAGRFGALGAAFALALVCVLDCTTARAQADEPDWTKAAGPRSWVDDLTPIGEADWSYQRAAHLLERAGFGGTPGEIGRLAAMTPEEAVA